MEEFERLLVDGLEEVWDLILEDNVETPDGELKTKKDYVDNIKIGMLVAFKINNVKMLSGMVNEIHEYEYVVKTKNGINFKVNKRDIVWVKTGDRWPRGIFLALRGEQNNG